MQYICPECEAPIDTERPSVFERHLRNAHQYSFERASKVEDRQYHAEFLRKANSKARGDK